MASTFKFIDLFAGIGGVRIPFDELGGSCVFTSEIDKFARETYAQNFPSGPSHIFAGDITKVHEGEVPDHDVLLGGFPCQPFSHAGKRQGFDDTRGTLFFHVARIIEAKAPKVVLLENVRGLVTHDGGNTLRRIVEILEETHFVQTVILNSKDFGLPQTRSRVFILGLRKDLPGAETFILSSQPKDEMPTRLGAILEDQVHEKYTISDLLWSSHQKRKAKHLAAGNGWGYRLFDHESPYVSTISARYFKDGSEILVAQESKNPRKLSPREAARIQGFPEWFQIVCSDTQSYKQFGNAVSVNVIRFLATQVVQFLI